jgi:hypothetical protein
VAAEPEERITKVLQRLGLAPAVAELPKEAEGLMMVVDRLRVAPQALKDDAEVGQVTDGSPTRSTNSATRS